MCVNIVYASEFVYVEDICEIFCMNSIKNTSMIDNQSALKCKENFYNSKLFKRIEIKAYFIKDFVAKGII